MAVRRHLRPGDAGYADENIGDHLQGACAGRRCEGRLGALDRLFSRSRREIEAHAPELVDNDTGHHLIMLAAELLAALRLWAQCQYRSAQAVRKLLEAVEPVTLDEIAAELQAANDADPTAAAKAIKQIVLLPSEHLAGDRVV